MKKLPLLHSEISGLVASLGHNDMLVVGDAGLPIPAQTKRIDLALTKGVPGFIETVSTILTEMQVERIILAEETGRVSPQIQAEIERLLPGTPIETVSHDQLKELSHSARAVIRTGEFTPYANIILVSGVVF